MGSEMCIRDRGIVFLLYRSSTHESINLRDMAKEVDRVEGEIERSE